MVRFLEVDQVVIAIENTIVRVARSELERQPDVQLARMLVVPARVKSQAERKLDTMSLDGEAVHAERWVISE